jgi:hypothetical protein
VNGAGDLSAFAPEENPAIVRLAGLQSRLYCLLGHRHLRIDAGTSRDGTSSACFGDQIQGNSTANRRIAGLAEVWPFSHSTFGLWAFFARK